MGTGYLFQFTYCVPCKQKVVHGIELLYNLSFSGRYFDTDWRFEMFKGAQKYSHYVFHVRGLVKNN